MDVNQIKKLLGNTIENLSDEQIQELLFQCKKMASIILDFAQKIDQP